VSEETPRTQRRRPAGSAARWLLLGLLTVALLASLGLTAWLASQRGGAEDEQLQRERVMQTSRTFMLRMGTYGPDLLDDQGRMSEYRTRVRELITPKFRASFDKTAPVVDKLVGQAGVSREAEVFSAGVASLDPDRATALVAGSFTDSYRVKGKARPQEPVPFRLEVQLRRIDGEWLVDDYTPVARAEEGTAPAPGGLPGQGGAQ